MLWEMILQALFFFPSYLARTKPAMQGTVEVTVGGIRTLLTPEGENFIPFKKRPKDQAGSVAALFVQRVSASLPSQIRSFLTSRFL